MARKMETFEQRLQDMCYIRQACEYVELPVKLKRRRTSVTATWATLAAESGTSNKAGSPGVGNSETALDPEDSTVECRGPPIH